MRNSCWSPPPERMPTALPAKAVKKIAIRGKTPAVPHACIGAFLETRDGVARPAREIGLRNACTLQFGEELIMQKSATVRASTDFVFIHPLDPEDAAITAVMRPRISTVAGNGRLRPFRIRRCHGRSYG
jgi:hypothetical protein